MTLSASTSTHDSDSDLDFSPPPRNLHSFSGTPRTWRHLTEYDRALARSLDALQNTDLSIHLYNAHALKRRLYIPIAASAALPSSDDDDASTPDTARTMVQPAHPAHHASKSRWLPASPWRPPPSWTAWPVPAWCAGRAARGVVQELHDCVVASMSCRARAAYAQREDATPDDSDDGRTTERGATAQEAPEREATQRGATGSARPRSARSETSGADLSTLDGDCIANDRANNSSRSRSPPRKRQRTNASDAATEFPVPVPLADDERIARLLGPHARHTVSRVEELLLALHRAREAQDLSLIHI